MCALAVKETAMACATEMHKDDPTVAAMAAATAMENVLAKYLVARTDTPGASSYKSDSESKIAREAILEGITGVKGLTDSERSKGEVYKRAKLLPPFPGHKCRIVPDAWEE